MASHQPTTGRAIGAAITLGAAFSSLALQIDIGIPAFILLLAGIMLMAPTKRQVASYDSSHLAKIALSTALGFGALLVWLNVPELRQQPYRSVVFLLLGVALGWGILSNWVAARRAEREHAV